MPICQIVGDYALGLGTKKGQLTELREFLECWGDIMLLHTSLLFHTPRSPVEDKELSTDCLHNHYCAHFPAVERAVWRVLSRMTGRFLTVFRLSTALLGRKIVLR